jgi:hypothetical protein
MECCRHITKENIESYVVRNIIIFYWRVFWYHEHRIWYRVSWKNHEGFRNWRNNQSNLDIIGNDGIVGVRSRQLYLFQVDGQTFLLCGGRNDLYHAPVCCTIFLFFIE